MPKLYNIDSFDEDINHIYDDYTNKGFEYESNIMRKVLSPELFANPLNDVPIRQIERIIEQLIRSVKQIKLHFAIAYPKNSKLIN